MNRFDQIIEEWWPRIRDAFMRAIRTMRSFAQVQRIAERLERGDIEGAVRAAGIDPVHLREIEKAIAEAYEAGGQATAKSIPPTREPDGFRLSAIFDIRNPVAEAWLLDRSAALVSGIAEEQRAMVRSVLHAGMVAGENPRSVALDIVGRINRATGQREGGLIGLTMTQQGYVDRARNNLLSGDPARMREYLALGRRDKRFDRTVLRAIREDKALTRDEVRRITGRLADRYLMLRGEVVARTEAMTALHQAAYEAMRQNIERGVVDEAAVTKVWHSARDKRVRDTHQALDGQSVGFRAEFVSPSGARLQFPGDPAAPAAEVIQCRCWCDFRVNFLAGLR